MGRYVGIPGGSLVSSPCFSLRDLPYAETKRRRLLKTLKLPTRVYRRGYCHQMAWISQPPISLPITGNYCLQALIVSRMLYHSSSKCSDARMHLEQCFFPPPVDGPVLLC